MTVRLIKLDVPALRILLSKVQLHIMTQIQGLLKSIKFFPFMSQLLQNIWSVHCRATSEIMPGRGRGGIVPFILQADDPWIHPDTCHPFRCFQRPCGSALPGWSLICMNLGSPSGQRQDILCLPYVCWALLFSALFVVTWNNTECIILGVL